MSIQPINNDNYQTQNSDKSDVQTFKTDPKALQSDLSSGDQYQVAISESALSTALTQLTSDFPNNTQGPSTGVGSSGQAQDAMQPLQNDLLTLQSALSSSTGNSQGTSSSNSSLSTALNNVLNALSTINSQELGRIHLLQPATVKALFQTQPWTRK